MGKTSGRYSTVHNPRSKDELERLLAKTQRRRAATQIANAARRRAAKKKTALARVNRIISKAQRAYTPPARGAKSKVMSVMSMR